MYSSSGDINVIIHEFPNPNAPNEVEPPVRQKFEAIGPLPSNPSLPPSPKIQIKAVEKLKAWIGFKVTTKVRPRKYVCIYCRINRRKGIDYFWASLYFMDR